jgi:diacylglycerol kinase family enzyme
VLIAFDYDGTLKGSYEFDKAECKLWGRIMQSLEDAGYRVIICSMRYYTDEDMTEIHQWKKLAGYNAGVVFCGGKGTKDEVCKSLGLKVDIWVDDMPESIRGK